MIILYSLHPNMTLTRMYVYIEDRPVNIDELRERGHKVIMFAHAYNASTESDWIAYDWNDVHDIIKTMNA